MFHKVSKIKFRISWILERVIWAIVKPYFRIFNNKKTLKQITIGISTFMDRYENCFIPLINKLAILFYNQQIIITANGHVKQEEQKKYLEQIKEFCSKFSNIELISFVDPKGLSHLWNTIISRAMFSKVLMLNDDIQIKIGFPGFIYTSGILKHELATINSSWSHFLISKELFQKVGPFDEGLAEIGGEDDDYSARLALKGIKIEDFPSNSIAGKLKKNRRLLACNSYGKNMNIEANGYSSVNSNYLSDKWETSMEYFPGAILVPNRHVRYWKLKNEKEH